MKKLLYAVKHPLGSILYLKHRRAHKRRISREQQVEEYLIMKNIPEHLISPLTAEETQFVASRWNIAMGGGNALSNRELGVFKHIRGFDERYLSHYLYLPLIARRLNNYKYTKLFEHKSLLGFLSSRGVKYPKCIIRCIDGEYYSEDMHHLNKSEAMSLCMEYDILIIKDSIDSSGGKSVDKIVLTGLNNLKKTARINEIFCERKRDFVIQEYIRQHPIMAQFNPASVNTIRVTTLYLNGKYSVCSSVLRMGKNGAITDNLGNGGIIIGVDSSGQLAEKGYDNSLNEYTQSNNVVFKNTVIPQIPAILEHIQQAHINNFSLCKFIGWDVCIDEKEDFIIIEINGSQPGIFAEQICTGPIFGERTNEVIDYCCSKVFRY